MLFCKHYKLVWGLSAVKLEGRRQQQDCRSFEVKQAEGQPAKLLRETIANGPKQEYTPRLTCPPSSKVSQVEMRQVIARVTCLAFFVGQAFLPVQPAATDMNQGQTGMSVLLGRGEIFNQ